MRPTHEEPGEQQASLQGTIAVHQDGSNVEQHHVATGTDQLRQERHDQPGLQLSQHGHLRRTKIDVRRLGPSPSQMHEPDEQGRVRRRQVLRAPLLHLQEGRPDRDRILNANVGEGLVQ